MSRKRNILCLGVSYPDLARLGLDDFYSTNIAIDSVRSGALTQMDGRDLARCLATEQHCNVNVFTVSQEKASLYRLDRHLDSNFNRCHCFIKQLRSLHVSFDQIILDWFWIPPGWDDSHWSKSFFSSTLPALSEFLQDSQSTIYLPFCLHCFKQIVDSFDILKIHYDISFLRKDQQSEITLWSGTQTIDETIMQQVLGKRLNQEDTYCTFRPHHIQSMENTGVSKQKLLNILHQLEEFEEIRFLKLTPTTTSSRGCFLGLVDTKTVRNGFRNSSKKSITEVRKRKRHLVTPDVKPLSKVEPAQPLRPRRLF